MTYHNRFELRSMSLRQHELLNDIELLKSAKKESNDNTNALNISLMIFRLQAELDKILKQTEDFILRIEQQRIKNAKLQGLAPANEHNVRSIRNSFAKDGRKHCLNG